MFVSHARGKIQELNTEIIRLTRELEKYQQENATYLTYEKRLEYNRVVHVPLSKLAIIGLRAWLLRLRSYEDN